MVVEIVFRASTLQPQASRALIFATTALQGSIPRRLGTAQRKIAIHARKERTWTKLGSKSAKNARRWRLPKKVQQYVQSATLDCSCQVLMIRLRPVARYVVGVLEGT